MNGDEYRRITKALACETRMSDASSMRIEQELVRAIPSRAAGDAAHPPVVWAPRKSFMWLPPAGRGKWLVAAAVVVLIAGTMVSWTLSRAVVTTATGARQAVSATPFREDVGPGPKEVPIAPIGKTPQGPRGNRGAHRVQTTRVLSPTGFVELPWSAGLPAFESGEIVRMEVPVASLPAYGIDISPGVGTRPLEADLLIGQDGFARAIRLVTQTAMTTPRSTQ